MSWRGLAVADGCGGSPGPAGDVVITGLALVSAFGRGTQPLLDHAFAGESAFSRVSRFDVSMRRARAAAYLPGAPVLAEELASTVNDACTDARLTRDERALCPLLLAARADPASLRHREGGCPPASPGAMAAVLAARCGLSGRVRAYTGACVASSTAVAAAASAIRSRGSHRIAVAAGYLVDADQFALFDAARALADDGQVRPFSKGRRGTLLGDAVVAVVFESASAARQRGARVLARLAGWGRAGEAHDISRPHPGGGGLARAILAALASAGIAAGQIGYVNANGTGAVRNDPSEANALRDALGTRAADIPVSGTKSVHGHALEASALLELVMTLLALRAGRLPVNAGFIEPDERCQLNLVLQRPRPAAAQYALTVNAALGGASTALVVAVP